MVKVHNSWSTAYTYKVTYDINTTNSFGTSSWDNAWGGTASYNTKLYRSSGGTSSGFSDTVDAWGKWITAYENEFVRESSEERETRLERERERREIRKRERAEAKQKAQELLFSLLNREQRKEFMAHNLFHVVASDGRLFRLKLGRQHNVFEVDVDGNKVREYCGHVGELVPDEDNLVAQMLLIQSDVSEFERVCNIWDLRNGRRITSRTGEQFAVEVAA